MNINRKMKRLKIIIIFSAGRYMIRFGDNFSKMRFTIYRTQHRVFSFSITLQYKSVRNSIINILYIYISRWIFFYFRLYYAGGIRLCMYNNITPSSSYFVFTYGSVGKIFDSTVEVCRFSQRGRHIFRRCLVEIRQIRFPGEFAQAILMFVRFAQQAFWYVWKSHNENIFF